MTRVVRRAHIADLRYLSVGNAADRGRPVADIAAACEVRADDVRALLALADGEQGRRTLWCAARGCDAYVRAATMAHALDGATIAGWRYDWRARLLCHTHAPRDDRQAALTPRAPGSASGHGARHTTTKGTR